ARRRRKPTELVCVVPECNSLGAALLGGGTLDDALARLEGGQARGLIVVEDDLYLRAPAARLDTVLERVERLAVIDAWDHRTARRAGLFLPATPWSESAGTWVNLEGRAQRFYAVQSPGGQRRCAWRWLARAGAGDWPDLDHLTRDLAADHLLFASLTALTPEPPGPVPRQPHRFSGRTALHAPEQMHEPPPPPDPDSPLVHSMEGLPSHLQPPALRPYRWQPGWDSHLGALNTEPEAADSGVRLCDGLARSSGLGTRLPGRRESIPGGSGPGHPGRVRPPAESPTPQRRWELIPRYHLFASEPLSALAPAIAARAPEPHVYLNPHDAAELGLAEGDRVRVAWDGGERILPVRHEPGLGRGTVALPWGQVPWFPPEAEAVIEPLEEGA
ncbi:MAG TPA: NADH-quinone oxidoreductase subunit G, partial [Sedimenticola sp.]|nr:NADH-quinone oxidoreductase subunit G [Sedimenticola sp.]